MTGAGCGGDDESPRDAYLSEVNGLCADAERRSQS